MPSPALKSAPESLTPVKRPKLAPLRLMDEAQWRRRLVVIAPEGLEKDDLRYPESWSLIGPRVSRHDIVTVVAADESWELECRVEAVKATGVEISIAKNLSRVGVTQAETQLGPDHYTQWRPGKGWCVVRNSDGHAIIQGHPIEASASAEFFRNQPKVVPQ